jgi:hypothetical protein
MQALRGEHKVDKHKRYSVQSTQNQTLHRYFSNEYRKTNKSTSHIYPSFLTYTVYKESNMPDY